MEAQIREWSSSRTCHWVLVFSVPWCEVDRKSHVEFCGAPMLCQSHSHHRWAADLCRAPWLNLLLMLTTRTLLYAPTLCVSYSATFIVKLFSKILWLDNIISHRHQWDYLWRLLLKSELLLRLISRKSNLSKYICAFYNLTDHNNVKNYA